MTGTRRRGRVRVKKKKRRGDRVRLIVLFTVKGLNSARGPDAEIRLTYPPRRMNILNIIYSRTEGKRTRGQRDTAAERWLVNVDEFTRKLHRRRSNAARLITVITSKRSIVSGTVSRAAKLIIVPKRLR